MKYIKNNCKPEVKPMFVSFWHFWLLSLTATLTPFGNSVLRHLDPKGGREESKCATSHRISFYIRYCLRSLNENCCLQRPLSENGTLWSLPLSPSPPASLTAQITPSFRVKEEMQNLGSWTPFIMVTYLTYGFYHHSVSVKYNKRTQLTR